MNSPSTSSQLHRPCSAQPENWRLVCVANRIMPAVMAANAINATPRWAYVFRKNATRSLTPMVATAPSMGRAAEADCPNAMRSLPSWLPTFVARFAQGQATVLPWQLAAGLELLDLRDQLGNGLFPFLNDAVIGDLEDRLVLVLVDRDDRLGALHAGEVLDRARDRDGEVQVGGDDLAGLADLPVRRDHAGVGRRARCAHRRAEQVGELLEHLEVLAVLHAAAARHHDLGVRQLGPIALLRVEPHELGAECVDRAGGRGGHRAR